MWHDWQCMVHCMQVKHIVDEFWSEADDLSELDFDERKAVVGIRGPHEYFHCGRCNKIMSRKEWAAEHVPHCKGVHAHVQGHASPAPCLSLPCLVNL